MRRNKMKLAEHDQRLYSRQLLC